MLAVRGVGGDVAFRFLIVNSSRLRSDPAGPVGGWPCQAFYAALTPTFYSSQAPIDILSIKTAIYNVRAYILSNHHLQTAHSFAVSLNTSPPRLTSNCFPLDHPSHCCKISSPPTPGLMPSESQPCPLTPLPCPLAARIATFISSDEPCAMARPGECRSVTMGR